MIKLEPHHICQEVRPATSLTLLVLLIPTDFHDQGARDRKSCSDSFFIAKLLMPLAYME